MGVSPVVIAYDANSLTVKFYCYDDDNLYLNTTTGLVEEFNSGNMSHYLVGMSDTENPGTYKGAFPECDASILPRTFNIVVFDTSLSGDPGTEIGEGVCSLDINGDEVIVATPTGDGFSRDMCAGFTYAQRLNIEQIFGRTNVFKWADINNDQNASDVAIRICWALNVASNRITDRLTGGPYTMPFQQPYPEQLVEQTARMAGVLLYNSRGMVDVDDDDTDPITNHQDQVKEFVLDILSSRLRFRGVSYAVSSTPMVVKDHHDEEMKRQHKLIHPNLWWTYGDFWQLTGS